MSGQRELWTRLLLLGREWEKWALQQHSDISVKLHGWLGMKMPPGFLSLHKWGFFFPGLEWWQQHVLKCKLDFFHPPPRWLLFFWSGALLIKFYFIITHTSKHTQLPVYVHAHTHTVCPSFRS